MLNKLKVTKHAKILNGYCLNLFIIYQATNNLNSAKKGLEKLPLRLLNFNNKRYKSDAYSVYCFISDKYRTLNPSLLYLGCFRLLYIKLTHRRFRVISFRVVS